MKEYQFSLYEKIDKYIHNYLLSAKFLVQGNSIGNHLSIFQNKGDEFIQYKNYFFGDDTSKIDWKVYSRSKNLVIKNYREEKNKNTLIIVDGSGSMKYSLNKQSKITKWQHAAILVNGISYIYSKQKDNTGVAFYNDKKITSISPSGTKNHLERINQLSLDFTPTGEADHLTQIKKIINSFKANTIIFVSDLLEQEDKILNLFKIYSSQKKRIIFLHLLHQDEFHLSEKENSFIHLENNKKINLSTELVQKEYKKNLDIFLKKISKVCHKEGFIYQKISTIEDVANSLLKFCSKF